MGNFYSAGRDPIFYCHHANVDRCWYIWDTIPDRRQEHYSDTDFLDSSFVFYDENAELVQVSVKDWLDPETQLGITFEPCPGSNVYRTSSFPQPLGKVRGVVPKGKANLPEGLPKSKSKFEKKLGVSEALPVVVKRPTGKSAFAQAKGIAESQVEEVLVLEGFTIPSQADTVLTVFINLPDANASTSLDCAEYVGTYASLPHMGMGMGMGKDMGMGRMTDIRFSITANIANLGIEDQDSFVVTVVSNVVKTRASQVTIGGFNIQYV